MKTILIVDDDELIRETFSLILQNHGYRVIEADSGNAGFEIARQQLPDLILSDISMPGGDGRDLLNNIRQDPELSAKQVVLMTGDANAVTPRKGMEAGADDFLVKPVTVDALLRCVGARLNRAQIHWRVEDRVLSHLRSSLHSTLPHEFFTPLAGIVGLTGILRTDFRTFTADEIQEMLDDIHLSAHRLHRTLKNYLLLLDLQNSAADTESMAKRLSIAELRESIESGVAACVNPGERREDVAVEVEKCSIHASAGDLRHIVEELVGNACNYSRQGTPVAVHFGGDGVLTVTDAGRGMTPEEIEKIGLFQQFDRRKREQQGLGVGLVLVQKLAARSGATLSIQSDSSSGTRVRVAFRIAGQSISI